MASPFPDVRQLHPGLLTVLGQNPGMMTGPGTNTYLLGERRPILLDTGTGKQSYIRLLRQTLQQHGMETISRIVVTHVHPDHIGGALKVQALFPHAPVYKMPWSRRDAAFEVKIMPLADGARIETESGTLRAIHTPGHARDHLCYYHEEDQLLFTGDLIVGVGTVVIPRDGGNMAHYLHSLRRLLQLDLRAIHPAHGPVIMAPYDKIQEYIDHRLKREHMVIEALRAGKHTIPEITSHIYVEAGPKLQKVAQQSVRAHLLKLEQEDVVESWSERQREMYGLL
jgi:glyoxylase-like metal-dependent hydrolase (beta-lactamase superfamily II)